MKPAELEGFIDAADVDSLRAGTGRTVEWKGQRMALFHLEGGFFAVEDACPHRGASLGAGWCEQGKVYCPLHGWVFDIRTGACETRPERPLKTFPVVVHGGRVWVKPG